MASKNTGSRSRNKSRHSDRRSSAKVGTDRSADRAIGGKLDFGIPAAKARAPQAIGGRDKGPEQGTGYTRSGSRGTRDVGVGRPEGRSGSGSGGDLDTDVVGLDGKGGVAAAPPSGRTRGPDITEGGSAAFASGPPAKGENKRPRGRHGAPSEIVRGSTVDRTGGDASTTGDGGGADSALPARGRSPRRGSAKSAIEPVPDNAAVGEISSGEAGGEDGG